MSITGNSGRSRRRGGTTIVVVEAPVAEVSPALAAQQRKASEPRVEHIEAELDGKAATVHTHAEADVTGLVDDLALKAPLASPALTGNPTAPTQTAGNNSTRLATTAFVATAVGAITPGATANQNKRKAFATFDGQGAAVAAGSKMRVTVPYSGTIVGARMLADVATNAVIDVWKDTYANWPPVVGDSIVAAAKPTLTAATKSEDTTLTGWTTTVTAGDVLIFNVDSCSAATWLACELFINAS